jgi:hypothetical protein
MIMARVRGRSGRIASALLASALFMVAGCKGATPIHDLLANASARDGQTVRIAGKVESAAGAFGYAVYRVDDGTGEINVVTKSGGAPAENTEVGVEGVFRQAFTIGTDVVAVIEETKRSAR